MPHTNAEAFYEFVVWLATDRERAHSLGTTVRAAGAYMTTSSGTEISPKRGASRRWSRSSRRARGRWRRLGDARHASDAHAAGAHADCDAAVAVQGEPARRPRGQPSRAACRGLLSREGQRDRGPGDGGGLARGRGVGAKGRRSTTRTRRTSRAGSTTRSSTSRRASSRSGGSTASGGAERSRGEGGHDQVGGVEGDDRFLLNLKEMSKDMFLHYAGLNRMARLAYAYITAWM